MAQTKSTTVVKNIVLVHGGFVDGSGWKGVYNVLKKDGYTVAIVQNPTISLADDVAVTKRAIAAQNGPVILVGHSYGGAVITEAGNDPKVAGLVYIAAFALDKGESVSSLMADSQVPWGVNALGGTISEAAWQAKPSWYLLTTEDKMIPPDAQRLMSKRAGATVVKGSHAVYVSQPQAVAHIIAEAARGALAASKEGGTSAAD
jgi:pimeloyl-ACP methyl ester carboxylesterase